MQIERFSAGTGPYHALRMIEVPAGRNFRVRTNFSSLGGYNNQVVVTNAYANPIMSMGEDRSRTEGDGAAEMSYFAHQVGSSQDGDSDITLFIAMP